MDSSNTMIEDSGTTSSILYLLNRSSLIVTGYDYPGTAIVWYLLATMACYRQTGKSAGLE
jgi:hypothetical protein